MVREKSIRLIKDRRALISQDHEWLLQKKPCVIPVNWSEIFHRPCQPCQWRFCTKVHSRGGNITFSAYLHSRGWQDQRSQWSKGVVATRVWYAWRSMPCSMWRSSHFGTQKEVRKRYTLLWLDAGEHKSQSHTKFVFVFIFWNALLYNFPSALNCKICFEIART